MCGIFFEITILAIFLITDPVDLNLTKSYLSTVPLVCKKHVGVKVWGMPQKWLRFRAAMEEHLAKILLKGPAKPRRRPCFVFTREWHKKLYLLKCTFFLNVVKLLIYSFFIILRKKKDYVYCYRCSNNNDARTFSFCHIYRKLHTNVNLLPT